VIATAGRIAGSEVVLVGYLTSTRRAPDHRAAAAVNRPPSCRGSVVGRSNTTRRTTGIRRARYFVPGQERWWSR
jgi:hypothetical protein